MFRNTYNIYSADAKSLHWRIRILRLPKRPAIRQGSRLVRLLCRPQDSPSDNRWGSRWHWAANPAPSTKTLKIRRGSRLVRLHYRLWCFISDNRRGVIGIEPHIQTFYEDPETRWGSTLVRLFGEFRLLCRPWNSISNNRKRSHWHWAANPDLIRRI